MGEKLGVSGTTISRFVRRLGCGNYKEFRRLMADQNIPEGPAVKLMQTLHLKKHLPWTSGSCVSRRTC